MHERGAIARVAHHLPGYLVAIERTLPICRLGFLRHRSPDVGVHGVRAPDRFVRIANKRICAPCRATCIACSTTVAGNS